jgi:DNA-binding LacI/PurR family transcriptional regulator
LTATIRDVAKRAGVGVGTVSRVINKSSEVRDSTRAKVLAVIKELDFTPNPIARSLSSGKTRAIGVIVPFFTIPSVILRLQGIEAVLSQADYDLVLFNVETPAKRDAYYRQAVRSDRFDGVLIISLSPNDEQAKRIAKSNVPVVLIDAFHKDLNCVVVDDYEGAKCATEYLISLGHQRIGLVTDTLDFNQVNSNRIRGYKDALKNAGISFTPAYHRKGNQSQNSGVDMTHQLMALPEPPSAIFALSDTLAIGVLTAAKEIGITVPEELSVVGYDDIEIAQYINLTTIKQPLVETGTGGVDLLLDIIQNVRRSPQTIKLPINLIERGTATTIHGGLL